MDTQEARGLLLAAIGSVAWADAAGHPDEVRHARLQEAVALGNRALRVLWDDAYASGAAAMSSELRGQSALPL